MYDQINFTYYTRDQQKMLQVTLITTSIIFENIFSAIFVSFSYDRNGLLKLVKIWFY